MTITHQKDLETISAYLDNMLEKNERSRFETRLASETDLRTALESLRRTRALLRSAPHYTAPRNFVLTPEMAGIRAQKPGFMFSLSRITFALTTILFAITLVGNYSFQGIGAPAADSAQTFAIEEPSAAESSPGELEIAAMPMAEAEVAPGGGQTDGTGEVASNKEPTPEAMIEESTQDSQSLAPPSEESLSVAAEESAEQTADQAPNPAETGPVVPETERSMEEGATSAADTQTLELAQPIVDETPGVNPWSMFVVLTGAAALFSGALTWVLRRR